MCNVLLSTTGECSKDERRLLPGDGWAQDFAQIQIQVGTTETKIRTVENPLTSSNIAVIEALVLLGIVGSCPLGQWRHRSRAARPVRRSLYHLISKFRSNNKLVFIIFQLFGLQHPSLQYLRAKKGTGKTESTALHLQAPNLCSWSQ
jgi:hypothetical protein